MKKLEVEVNFMKLKYLWSMFCGHENQLEEHYYVDEDDHKVYRKLTSIYTDEQIEVQEITCSETIVWIFAVHLTQLSEVWNEYKKHCIHLTDTQKDYLHLRVEEDLDDMPEEDELSVDMLTNLKSKLTNIKTK